MGQTHGTITITNSVGEAETPHLTSFKSLLI